MIGAATTRIGNIGRCNRSLDVSIKRVVVLLIFPSFIESFGQNSLIVLSAQRRKTSEISANFGSPR